MNIKDILFFALVALIIGVAANHYFDLDIGFLNDIEKAVISSGQHGKSSLRDIGGMGAETRRSGKPECESLIKTLGDARTAARGELAAAKKEGDAMRIRAAQERLDDLSRQERAACD